MRSYRCNRYSRYIRYIRYSRYNRYNRCTWRERLDAILPSMLRRMMLAPSPAEMENMTTVRPSIL